MVLSKRGQLLTISIDKDVVADVKKQSSEQMDKVAHMMMAEEKIGVEKKVEVQTEESKESDDLFDNFMDGFFAGKSKSLAQSRIQQSNSPYKSLL
jgi:hypothetical protein